MMTRGVGIYIFEDIEVLDLGGPFEVFATASRLRVREAAGRPQPFEVFTIAAAAQIVRSRGGLKLVPDFPIEDHPPVDILVVPGGVVSAELERPKIVQWIAETSAKASLTASVCTGAFLLAKAGLLAGKTITTHWEDIDDFRTTFPGISVLEDRRWVDEGSIVTSAGISAGIDMSLHLVSRLEGEALARRTARQMDYPWRFDPMAEPSELQMMASQIS